MLNTLQLTRLVQPRRVFPASRVLIADDDASLREGFAVCLSLYDEFDCVALARNGSEASYYVSKLHPDIVLMDVNMPHIDGVRATEYIHYRYPNVKVILMVDGELDDFTCAEARRVGASTCISKSMPVEELVHTIRTIS